MRKLAVGLLGAAALFVGTSASASITIGSVTPGTNPYSGPAPQYDFDTPGTTPPTSNGVVATGTVTDVRAQPYGSTGNYYAAGPTVGQPGVIDLTGWGDVNSLSFLWGSVDSFNTLEFLASDLTTVLATFTGNQIFDPANGSQTDPNLNPVVLFLLDGTDVTNFGGLRLTSGQNAFELDNLAINPVPEPGTWAMMLLGFGAAGYAMRRRRAPVLAQAA